MNAVVEGFRNYDFTDEGGKRITGMTLFVSYEENGVTGKMTDKLSVKSEISMPTVKPGDKIQVFFNRRGKVERIMPAQMTTAQAKV